MDYSSNNGDQKTTEPLPGGFQKEKGERNGEEEACFNACISYGVCFICFYTYASPNRWPLPGFLDGQGCIHP
jgi:hypothetical protein